MRTMVSYPERVIECTKESCSQLHRHVPRVVRNRKPGITIAVPALEDAAQMRGDVVAGVVTATRGSQGNRCRRFRPWRRLRPAPDLPSHACGSDNLSSASRSPRNTAVAAVPRDGTVGSSDVSMTRSLSTP